jgi:hypothetical protein
MPTPSPLEPTKKPESGPAPPAQEDRLAPLSSFCDPDEGSREPGRSAAGSREVGFPAVEGYEVLEVLAQGGHGVVYKARQKEPRRLVALKMVRKGAPAGADAVGRFRTEARAAARLRHPNIVEVYEAGEAGGVPFFSLEYIDGGSLDRRLQGRPQPARAAAGLVEVLARAIDYAHRQGIVHRDLKPANVLLARDEGEQAWAGTAGAAPPPRSAAEVLTRNPYGTPKIADFGLAGPAGDPAAPARPGAVLGTPSYMAPEQVEGRPDVGVPADVWGLGAILYEMLTGRPPFQGATVPDTLEQVRTCEPVPPARLQPRIPAALETICLRCLRNDPGKRYPGALELAEDLHRFLDGGPIRAWPVGRAWLWYRRHKALARTMVVGALLLVTVAAVSVFLAVHSGRTADELRREQESTLDALSAARMQEERAHERMRLAQARLAEHYLDRALALCERDANPAAGLLWLARTLESVPGDRADLDRVARANLATWHAEVPPRLAGENRETKKGRGPVLRQSGDVWAVAFSPDGGTVLTGNTGGGAMLWDAATGLALGPARHAFPQRDRAQSPDGRLLLGAAGRTARLWDAATGEPVGRPFSHKDAVLAVAFSPDGRSVLTGSRDGTAQLWDAATCRPVGPPWRHAGSVHAVAFRPDSRMAVTAGDDRTARLWEVAAPVDGEVERIRLWVQVRTGLELDEHGTVRALDDTALREHRRQLQEQDGPPLPGISSQ